MTSLLNGGRRHPLAAPTVEQAATPVALVASLPPRSAHSSKYDQARDEARAILRALTGPPKQKRQRIEMSRCRLCGQPSFGAYCHAHAFAYGEPLA